MKVKKAAALIMSVCMCVGMLAGCGKGGSKDAYTMWIYSAQDAAYYLNYEDNPVLKYLSEKTFGPEEKTVKFDFWVPPAGSQVDSYSTMIGSGDLPDVLDASIANSSLSAYKNGEIMDLTELIPEYMPNYMKFLEEHPELESSAYTEVDGEMKMLHIQGYNDGYPNTFCGPQYRRDWIVKYGTNPQTGAKFTGGYTDENDPDSWVDDVVFPSGETDPLYISDWEWMFEIFTEALAEEGITDGYCTSIYYPGFTWNGNFTSCFGGGTVMWYLDENNQVTFGADKEHFRAYLQCLNTWYNTGWLDKAFGERTGDGHFQIDDTTKRQGKVGLWVGLQSELGRRMDVGASEYTDGIYVAGCAWPINDVYGDDSCKYVEPNCVDTTSLKGVRYVVTSKAEGKDIPTLLSFFDYFYTEEGALLHTLGLNKEQLEEMTSEVYEKNGLQDGAYSIEDGKYLLAEKLQQDGGGLSTAVALTHMPGLTLVENVDKGYGETYQKSIDLWTKYPNTAFFQGTDITNNMPEEVGGDYAKIMNKVLDYLNTNAGDFIRGTKDPYNDADWAAWCKMLKKYNYDKASEIVQPYADKYTVN